MRFYDRSLGYMAGLMAGRSDTLTGDSNSPLIQMVNVSRLVQTQTVGTIPTATNSYTMCVKLHQVITVAHFLI